MTDYKLLSNKKLVSLCNSKDVLAWFEFVRRFQRLVSSSIAERLTRWNYNYQTTDVEDISQDVFFSIWEKELLKSLKRIEALIPWLAILSANKAVSFFRKRSNVPPRASSLFEDGEREPLDMRNPNPLEGLIFKDSLKNTLAAIKQLTPREKNILRLNILYKKTYAEIARLCGIPVGSVYSTAKRAREKIKENLKK